MKTKKIILDRIFRIVGVTLFILFNTSCSDFLDEKQEMKVVIPNSLQHLRAMLDNTSHTNFAVYSGFLEFGTDDYQMSRSAFNSISEFERQAYMFSPNSNYSKVELYEYWSVGYRPVFVANTVLDYIDEIKNPDPGERDKIIGTALFFRAFAFYQTAQIFAPPYDSNNSGDGLGIPLRLSSDFNEKSVRSSVHGTYQQITMDLKKAAMLLPLNEEFAVRPTKLAAWAMLARVSLLQSNYDQAFLYADSVLQHNTQLIDYKDIDSSNDAPFEILNKETIFCASALGGNILNSANADIADDLLALYEAEDLRKDIFFRQKAGDAYSFKGNYLGAVNSAVFTGITVSEVMLLKSECAQRLGNSVQARGALKPLLENRYAENYMPYGQSLENLILADVLNERRKELVFRGLRWSDLRRLNRDPQFRTEVVHRIKDIDGIEEFILAPESSKYVYPIPQEVIDRTGMQQNPR